MAISYLNSVLNLKFLAYKNPKNAHKNAQKNSKLFKPGIHNVVSTGKNFTKNVAFYMYLLAVLGSQGIVVKCIAAIFFRMADCTHLWARTWMLGIRVR